MSMDCPKCGSLSSCLDSRHGAEHTTVRRYECRARKCRARWSTVEQLVRIDIRKGAWGNRGRLIKALADKTNTDYRTKLKSDLEALLEL